MPTVTVKIENDYSDGYHSEREVEVEAPTSIEDEVMIDWFEDKVWPETGCGHDGDACYTATITRADDPTFVGEWKEWV